MEKRGTEKSYNYLFTADGKLYVDGVIADPSPSTNDDKYPASAGWKQFVFKKVTFYLLKKGGKLQVVPVNQESSTSYFINYSSVFPI